MLKYVEQYVNFKYSNRFIFQICEEVGKSKTGLSLLQFLYDKCLDVVGIQSLLHLALFLLEESAVPFFDFVSNLALRGHAVSAGVFTEEFGVTFNEGVLNRPKISFWDEVFITSVIGFFNQI